MTGAFRFVLRTLAITASMIIGTVHLGQAAEPSGPAAASAIVNRGVVELVTGRAGDVPCGWRRRSTVLSMTARRGASPCCMDPAGIQ